MSFDAIKGQTHATSRCNEHLRRVDYTMPIYSPGPWALGKRWLPMGLQPRFFARRLWTISFVCGLCGACLRFEQGQHPDFHSISRLPKSDGQLERYIKIDQVRALQKALSFKAFEGRRRVVLIVEPECMTESTANALLKTLEEPGRDTHFVLVSDAAHRLPPTVISSLSKGSLWPA